MDTPKKGRGCFFYGCLTTVILVILIAVVAYFGAQMALKKMTSTTPLPIPPTVLAPADGVKVVKRVQEFTELLKAGKATQPLELNSDELDYVVRNAKPEFRDITHVTITNNMIHADFSMPLFMINPALKGRYANGSSNIRVGVSNGGLDLDMDPPLPMMQKKSRFDPKGPQQGSDLIQNLEKIEIEDGKIRMIPKGATP